MKTAPRTACESRQAFWEEEMQSGRRGAFAATPLIVCTIFLLFFARPARAWAYEEHFEITLRAYDAACQQFAAAGVPTGAWCVKKHPRICLAHLVASAADHVSHVGRFRTQEGENAEYLVGPGADCRSPMEWDQGPPPRGSDASKDTPLPDIRSMKPLVAENLSRFFEYARLASANFDHFQPKSRDAWQRVFESQVVNRDITDHNQIVWNAGFALHFLEDSFSAGHNGLRRLPLRQDFAQIYHDDFNRQGILLSRPDGHEWFGYGDKNLHRRSRYVLLGPPDRGDDADVVKALAALGMAGTLSAEELRVFRASGERWRILSAAPAEGTAASDAGLLLCSFIDSCAKAQVVLVNPPAGLNGGSQCACAKVDVAAPVEVLDCPDSKAHVVEAATHAVRALILRLAGAGHESVEKDFRAARQLVPTAYRSITPGFGNPGLNAEPRSIRPTEPRSLEHPEPLDFRDWAFAADCISRTPTGGRRCSFDFGLSRLFERQTGGLDENLQVGVRFGVIDTRSRLLNSLDTALYYRSPDLRVLKNIVGVSPKVTLGLEQIWEGHRRRAYAGVGLSLDVHIGKTKLFVDYDQLAFRRRHAFQGTPFRLVMGVKLGSIALFQPAGD